ncbi:MAG: DNA polymerase III subunit beta [Planctomycetota bacterium]|nr:MAG: DNA polymerase III subunit beta [Planctomycetota bacterium]
MQLLCNRALFSSAFSIAASAVPSRTPKDILRNVFMSVTSSGVELVGTDQEMAIRYSVSGVTTSSFGDALLPTQRMSSILRELQDEQLELTIDEQNITLKAASAKFRLTSEDPREYPPVPQFSDENYFRIPAPVFRQMIRRTTFATDTESTRYALGGLLLEFNEGIVTLAATDSRRLAVATAACEKHGTPESPAKATVVPTKAMSLLERSIDPHAEFVDIAVHENDVMMRSGSCVVYSRLVEGRFPRYRDVIPRGGHVDVGLPVGPFFAAVRQSQIITDEESRGVDFLFGSSMLTLSSQASAIGESKIELPIEYDHDEVKITFDPKYVADFLKVLGPETQVNLQLIDSDTAAVFRVEDSYTYVIMPLAQDR